MQGRHPAHCCLLFGDIIPVGARPFLTAEPLSSWHSLSSLQHGPAAAWDPKDRGSAEGLRETHPAQPPNQLQHLPGGPEQSRTGPAHPGSASSAEEAWPRRAARLLLFRLRFSSGIWQE